MLQVKRIKKLQSSAIFVEKSTETVLGAAHRDIKTSKIWLMSRYYVAQNFTFVKLLQIFRCAAPF
jgi:hypothetical protein